MQVETTVYRKPPEHLRIKGLIRCRKALRMAEQAVQIAIDAENEEDDQLRRNALIARAKARMDWAAEHEKAWLLRRKRRAQATGRRRARNLRRKSR